MFRDRCRSTSSFISYNLLRTFFSIQHTFHSICINGSKFSNQYVLMILQKVKVVIVSFIVMSSALICTLRNQGNKAKQNVYNMHDPRMVRQDDLEV